MLNGDEVSGFIDFYYACNGNFMYDLAIAVNDWARTADNKLDPVLMMLFSMAMKVYVHYLMKNVHISLLHKEPNVFVSGYRACLISISLNQEK